MGTCDIVQEAQCSAHTRGVRWRLSEKEVQEGRDICIGIADSLHFRAKTNTSQSNNGPMFKNLKKKFSPQCVYILVLLEN